MKIALMMENSQANKNAIILKELNVVPATIKILPRVRFFTFLSIHEGINNKICRAEYVKLSFSSNEGYSGCN